MGPSDQNTQNQKNDQILEANQECYSNLDNYLNEKIKGELGGKLEDIKFNGEINDKINLKDYLGEYIDKKEDFNIKDNTQIEVTNGNLKYKINIFYEEKCFLMLKKIKSKEDEIIRYNQYYYKRIEKPDDLWLIFLRTQSVI